MRTTVMLAAALSVAAAVVVAAPGPGSAAAPGYAPRPLKIGYVDLTRLLKASRRRESLEAELKRHQGSLLNEQRMREQTIEQYRAEIEQFAMGTPERIKRETKLKDSLKEFEKWSRSTRQDLNRRFVELIGKIYDDVTREAAAVAREGNFDFVIKEQSLQGGARTRDEIVLQISQRIMLYSKPEYDLTDVVAKRMNARFAKEKDKAAAAKPPK